MRFLSSFLITFAVAMSALPLRAAEPVAPWVATWAAPALDYNKPVPIPGMAAPVPATLRDQTVRVRAVPAIGGTQVRVRVSNVFGTVPLHIRAASVAHSTGADALSPRTLQVLRFAGKPDVVLGPGAERWSDAVDLAVEPQQALGVSLYLADATRVATVFPTSDKGAWIAPGNATGEATLRGASPAAQGYFVTGVDVRRQTSPPVVAAFGDSITFGAAAKEGVQGGYPARLAQRLRGQPSRAEAPSVLNLGIGGNRLLTDGIGPRALDRFDRDVLAQSSVSHTIILIGINDIGLGAAIAAEDLPLEQLTRAMQTLVEKARARGIKVLLGTLTPMQGSAYFNEATEAKRQAFNRWIRGRQDVDGVIDFDTALRDPANPPALRPAYDSGDHLHPSDAGYAAMAAAVDVRELQE